MPTDQPEYGYIITWLFNTLNDLLVGTLAANVTKITAMITPFVAVGVTISLIWYSMAIMRGSIDMPLLDMMGRILRISLVTSIALAGGLYQTEISQTLVELPDSLVQTLFNTNIKSLPAQADTVLNTTTKIADELTTTKGWFPKILPDKQEIVMAMAAGAFSVGAALFTGIISVALLVVKVAMVLLASVGPIFILALLFEPTKDLFARWLSQVFNFLILTILVALLFQSLVAMQQLSLNAATEWVQNGDVPVFQVLGSFMFFTLAAVVIFMYLPTLASALTGGFSIQFSGPVNAGTASVRTAHRFITRAMR